MLQETICIKEQISNLEIQKILNQIQDGKKNAGLLKKNIRDSQDNDTLCLVDSIEQSFNQILNLLVIQKTPDKQKPIEKTHFTMKNYSLNDILKRSLPRNIPNGVKIQLPDSDEQVYGHMYKLIVLFSNLIENSIEAINENGTIKINAVKLADRLKIEVIDSGPGIPQKIMNSMFTSLKTTKQHGTGLGTKMAKTIMDLHGGKISVRNNPTTFTIELPLERS